MLTRALSTWGVSAAAQNNRQAVGAYPDAQQDTHALNIKGLHV